MSIIEKALYLLDKERRSQVNNNREPHIDLPVIHDDDQDTINNKSVETAYTADNNTHKNDSHVQSKNFNININKLNEKGYLTPNTESRRMFEQLRHIKMKLLSDVTDNIKSDKNVSNLFMVTSSVTGEGKTYTSLNLALSIAYEFNHTVLYIDADIAKRTATRLLELDKYQGIIDYLKGDNKKLSDYLLSTNIQKFSVLPSGTPYEMKTELFSSRKMIDLMNELSSRYSDRIIIIDTPPILQDTSASALIKHSDKVIVVIEAEKTPVHMIKKTISLINTKKPVLLVLNKSNQRINSEYGYYY